MNTVLLIVQIVAFVVFCFSGYKFVRLTNKERALASHIREERWALHLHTNEVLQRVSANLEDLSIVVGQRAKVMASREFPYLTLPNEATNAPVQQISHERARQLIRDNAHGLLPPKEANELADHLLTCDGCFHFAGEIARSARHGTEPAPSSGVIPEETESHSSPTREGGK